jgi:hypothetical protein
MVALRKSGSKGALAGSTVVELVGARNELRKIQREIGRVNSRTQIDHLMRIRKKIASQIEQLEALLSKKSPKPDPLDLRIFQAICRSFGVYGQGVAESVLRKFEYESGLESLEIINNASVFCKCVESVFGRQSSKEIVNSFLFEISDEFGLQLSKRSDLSDAIKIARASVPMLEFDDEREEARVTQGKKSANILG